MRIRVIKPNGSTAVFNRVQALSTGGQKKDNELILLRKHGEGSPVRYEEGEWVKMEIEREAFNV